MEFKEMDEQEPWTIRKPFPDKCNQFIPEPVIKMGVAGPPLIAVKPTIEPHFFCKRTADHRTGLVSLSFQQLCQRDTIGMKLVAQETTDPMGIRIKPGQHTGNTWRGIACYRNGI